MTETTMVNLSVLAKLSLGERLRVRHGRFFQLYARRNNGGFRFVVPESVQRWWDGSTRHSDFQQILDTYENASSTLDKLGKEVSDQARATERALVKRMRESVDGLNTLSRTYADDITLVSRIQRLRERVVLICDKYPLDEDALVPLIDTDDNSRSVLPESMARFSLNADAPSYCSAEGAED